MRQKGHGVIGMKLIGNGDFTDPADREKAIRFVMQVGPDRRRGDRLQEPGRDR